MKRYFTVIAIIALCLWSCSKDETVKVEDDKPTVPTYHFSIRASVDPNTKGVTFDAGGTTVTSRFESTDRIYVYNQTKHAVAKYWDDDEEEYLAQAINPSNISINGKTCSLSGDLTFYDDDDNPVSVSDGDTYSLFYQMNYPNDPPSWGGPNYDYTIQKGTAATASRCDFAIATDVVMILDEVNNTLSVPEGVSFQPIQSMFRQHLTFTKESSPVNPASFKWLGISSENGTLVKYIYPLNNNPFTIGNYALRNPVIANDQDVYLSLSFHYPDDASKDDKLYLTAIDNEDNVFRSFKAVPSGGFSNNKYYYGNMALVWQYQMIKPYVTRTDGGDEDELNPEFDRIYPIASCIFDFSDADPAEVTISGNSNCYHFIFEYYAATVTLTGNGIAYYESREESSQQKQFIYGEDNLSIILDSDYSITCPNSGWAINAFGYLTLSTTGGTQKLTVTTNSADEKGIHGGENYRNPSFSVENLAAPGFIVTRSDTIDNGDGTYTWIYTVRPSGSYEGWD